MANNIGGRPWVIDTASPDVIKSGNVRVKALVFSGYASPADQCIVTANDGNGAGASRITVTTLQGAADLSAVSFNEGAEYWLRELAVPTLTSGVLQVFV